MTESRVRVGTVDYPVAKKTVQRSVDIVELSGTLAVPVKPATARKWRKEAPPKMGFALEAPKHLFEALPKGAPLPGDPKGYGGFSTSDENINLFKEFGKTVAALEAESIVILTPASFTPAMVNRTAFATFLETARKELEITANLVWEPKGPWETEEAADFAASNDLVLAVDPLRDPPPLGQTAYFRLGPFAAMGSRMGLYDLERLGDAIAPFENATCVFHTNRSLDDARNLKKVLAGDFVDA